MYESKHTDSEATIEVLGRDQPDKKFMLSRNKETLCWDVKGEKSPGFEEYAPPVFAAMVYVRCDLKRKLSLNYSGCFFS